MSPKRRPLRILVTGDLCPQAEFTRCCRTGRVDALYRDLLPDLRDKDLSITNLECPITLADRPADKTGPTVRAHPDSVRGIAHAGFDVVALANNHVMDFGAEGLRDTLNACRSAGLKTVGAGDDLAAAGAPLLVEAAGTPVAILNMAEQEFGMAGPMRPGANPLDPIALARSIRAAHRQAEAIIVIIHGGHERYPLPSPRIVQLFRFAAECGAAAVIGHHTHCPGPYEVWNRVPLFYGLGDFLFEWPMPQGSARSGSYLVRLRLAGPEVKEFDVVPFCQAEDGASVHRLDRAGRERMLADLADSSRLLADPRALEARFGELVSQRSQQVLSGLLGLGSAGRRVLPVLLRAGLPPARRGALRLMLNLIRCESHREVALATLERILSGRR